MIDQKVEQGKIRPSRSPSKFDPFDTILYSCLLPMTRIEPRRKYFRIQPDFGCDAKQELDQIPFFGVTERNDLCFDGPLHQINQ